MPMFKKLSVLDIITEGDINITVVTEVIMKRFRPYLMDIVVGVFFILLPGIRGYSNWQIHEYALIFLICGYIVYLHHKRTTIQ
jgi:hypothetical protein